MARRRSASTYSRRRTPTSCRSGDSLKIAAEDIRKLLPAGTELKLLRSTSDFVRAAVNNVKVTIIEGALLTVLIVFLFLGSWRSTVITGLTLPIAVIATFIALRVFGFTLNFMTMMALSLCIGLLIDDAIVVRENIVRHIHMGKDHYTAAREGTDEIGLAVMATTFSIVRGVRPDRVHGRHRRQVLLIRSASPSQWRCWCRCSSASRWTRCCRRYGAIRRAACTMRASSATCCAASIDSWFDVACDLWPPDRLGLSPRHGRLAPLCRRSTFPSVCRRSESGAHCARSTPAT